MRRVTLVATLIALLGTLFGQSDTLSTYHLNEVVVEDKMYQAITGLDQFGVDSVILSNSEGSTFAELARRNGFQEIRSYGANGLSVPSLRGTDGEHTALLWNGINLQSALNGTADLSLLTVNSTDQINIVKGGSSTQFGAGAIGGAIQINNIAEYGKGFSLSSSQELGSFGNYYAKYGLQYGGSDLAIQVAYFQRSLDNDYSYINLHTREQSREVRENSALEQRGMTSQIEYRLTNESVIGARAWVQSNDFEIPSPVFSTPIISRQLDETDRYMAYWTMGKPDYSFSFKTAYLKHLTGYENETTSQDSESEFLSLINKMEFESYANDDRRLIMGINHRWDQTKSNTHPGSPTRNTYSMYGTYLLSISALKMNIGARQEIYDDELSPFLPSLGMEYQVTPRFIFKGNVSRNYRLPTFNDLYWGGPGGVGNPELEAESSFNIEFGFVYQKSPKFTFKSTGYRYDVDNWIDWRPATPTEWTPDNIKNVVSKGIDSRLEMTALQSSDFNIKLQASHLWSLVTNQEVDSIGNLNELGNQLTYRPKHSGSVVLLADTKVVNAVISWSYFGEQFTEGENKSRFAIAPYATLNASLSRKIHLSDKEISLRASLNNILNQQYENRRGYPMYGRNFLIGITLKFNNKP